MKKVLLTAVAVFSLMTCSGCVRRIVTIDSQPQGAQVYFGRKLIGQTPCNHEFLYYGTHYLELVKEGYSNLTTTIRLKGPFYEYFPFSFISEVLIPWQITDRHNFSFELQEGQAREPVISPITQPQPSLASPELERIIP